MLTFLSGTYFPAKKDYIYDKIHSLLENGERVYLIVPEQAGFIRERDFLLTYGEKYANLLNISSFTHLSRDVLEENGLKVKPDADESAKNVIMSFAVSDCEEQLEIYRRHSGRASLIGKLLDEYAEISGAGLTTEDLRKVTLQLPEGILRRKTDELSLIFSVLIVALEHLNFLHKDLLPTGLAVFIYSSMISEALPAHRYGSWRK